MPPRASRFTIPPSVSFIPTNDTENYFQRIVSVLKPGTPREKIRRALYAVGKLPAASGREDEFIDELNRHQFTDDMSELQLSDGTWIKRSDHKLPGGGVVSVRTDITAIKRREQALNSSEKNTETYLRTRTIQYS